MSKTVNELKSLSDKLDELNITISDFGKADIDLLIEILNKVPDFRTNYLIKYSSCDLLAIIIFAKLKVDKTSFCGIADYAVGDKKWLKEMGFLHGDVTPSHDTIRRFISKFDGDFLKSVFVLKIQDIFKKIQKKYMDNTDNKYSILSVDGKEFRGSGRKEGTDNPSRNLATLNIYDVGTGCCIYSIPIEKKDNEISALKEVLPSIKLKNVIVTADALHCQRDMCETIRKKKGYYVLTCKDNQSTLKNDIAERFKVYNEQKTCKIGTITDHKTNKREFQILQLKSTYAGVEWPGVKTYIKMISHVKDNKNNTNKTPQYFVSSLVDTEAIIEAIERRWEIEDGYHKFKDDYLKEDTCTFKDQTAVKNMAIINSVIYALFKVSESLLKDVRIGVIKIKYRLYPVDTIVEVLQVLNGKNLTKLLNEQLNKKKKEEK